MKSLEQTIKHLIQQTDYGVCIYFDRTKKALRVDIRKVDDGECIEGGILSIGEISLGKSDVLDMMASILLEKIRLRDRSKGLIM